MQRRPQARSRPRHAAGSVEIPCDMLETFRLALADGMTREGNGYAAPGTFGAVISDTVAQYLVDCGIARRDGRRLVLNTQ